MLSSTTQKNRGLKFQVMTLKRWRAGARRGLQGCVTGNKSTVVLQPVEKETGVW